MIFLSKAYPALLAYLSPCLAFLKAGKSWQQTYSYKYFAPYFDKILSLVEKLPPMVLQVHTSAPTHVFTDATNTQLSLVLPAFTAAARIEHTQIYRAEADAVSWMLSQSLPEKTVIRTDNQALMYALQKGRSNIPEANRACKLLFFQRMQGKVITVKHVRTNINPADAPSRMFLGPSGYFVSPQFVCH